MRFARLALKGVVQNNGRFMDTILLCGRFRQKPEGKMPLRIGGIAEKIIITGV